MLIGYISICWQYDNFTNSKHFRKVTFDILSPACTSSPCKYPATCADGYNTTHYSCYCENGYSGRHCDEVEGIHLTQSVTCVFKKIAQKVYLYIKKLIILSHKK